MNDNPILPQKPYVLRAMWEWCSDMGHSPQIAVLVDAHCEVPMAFVQNEHIVLDVSSEATNQLVLGNEWISFQARFGERVENIHVPVGNVVAIFSDQTQQGMSFEPELLGDAAINSMVAQDAVDTNMPSSSAPRTSTTSTPNAKKTTTKPKSTKNNNSSLKIVK